jgi:hypothetical protein
MSWPIPGIIEVFLWGDRGKPRKVAARRDDGPNDIQSRRLIVSLTPTLSCCRQGVRHHVRSLVVLFAETRKLCYLQANQRGRPMDTLSVLQVRYIARWLCCCLSSGAGLHRPKVYSFTRPARPPQFAFKRGTRTRRGLNFYLS